MNKYEHLSVAGEGAYGVVLKCKHKETGEVVAIKQFRKPDDDAEDARLAQREVKILKALKHENIVELREVFRSNGALCLVFEFMEMCAVDMLRHYPCGLGHETTQVLVLQLLRALECCHSQSIIHRDIKPDNLLVNPGSNSLRLCDFGSARKAVGKVVLTDYVATRWYRAPELLVSFDNYSAGVDMWGSGCVMVELLSGQPLFAGNTDIDQLCLINSALGPLTAAQAERCLELSNFQYVRFGPPDEAQSLKKRFGRTMNASALQFLECIVVMEPSRRLSAQASLLSPWLVGVVAPSTSKQSRCAPKEVSSRSNLGNQADQRGPSSSASHAPSLPKPRIRRGISPYAGAMQSVRANGYMSIQQARHGVGEVAGLTQGSSSKSPVIASVGILGLAANEHDSDESYSSVKDMCSRLQVGSPDILESIASYHESIQEQSYSEGPSRSRSKESDSRAQPLDQFEESILEDISFTSPKTVTRSTEMLGAKELLVHHECDSCTPQDIVEEITDEQDISEEFSPTTTPVSDGFRPQNNKMRAGFSKPLASLKPRVRPVSRESARSSLTPICP